MKLLKASEFLQLHLRESFKDIREIVSKMKNPFRTKKQAYAFIGTGFLFSGFSMLFGITSYWNYHERGYTILKSVVVYGERALILGYVFFVIGTVILLYTIYWSISVMIFNRRNDYALTNSKPETYVCPRCETAFSGALILECKCMKCGSKIEDLVGFYERHPDLRPNLKL